jgi:glutamate/tyrosine decarboxylase-like PLP-dependent enzyme
MLAQDVRLDETSARLLLARAEQLSGLGSLVEERVELEPADTAALRALAERLANMYPYHEGSYIGQILKPPHPLTWAAYALTMLLNPNNHALDGGPATAELEREAIEALRGMFRLPQALGHLTSSGTIANLEALWVARELHPAATILSGENAHYTHERMCRVLNVSHETLPQDGRGRMNVDALDARLKRGGIGTVVATLGTTGLGALDPIDEILAVCLRYGVRLHVDAAYGGFFALLADGVEPGVAQLPFSALARVDSVVVDPHKHGLQPYGCGAVLFSDPSVGRLYAHDSPYTYFTSRELHLGEISLECSRPGSAAAALWATLQALPLTRGGLGRHLAGARAAALAVSALLREGADAALVVPPELDIICPFASRPRTSDISAASDAAFESLAADGWHVAKLQVDAAWLAAGHAGVMADTETATVLRCCLMKPEHATLAGAIAAALGSHLAAA